MSEQVSDSSPAQEAGSEILSAVLEALGRLPGDIGTDAGLMVGMALIESVVNYALNVNRPDVALAICDQLQVGLDNLREAALGEEEAAGEADAIAAQA